MDALRGAVTVNDTALTVQDSTRNITVQNTSISPESVPLGGRFNIGRHSNFISGLFSRRRERDSQLLSNNNLSPERYRVVNVSGEVNAVEKSQYISLVAKSSEIYRNVILKLQKLEKNLEDRTLEDFVSCCLDTIVDNDDMENKKRISLLSENVHISSENFIGFHIPKDESYFFAKFKPDITLKFSNRGGLEFRGERLREVMLNYSYNHLKDLFWQIFNTKYDQQLSYTANNYMKQYLSSEAQIKGLSKEQTNDLKRKFEGYKVKGIPLIELMPAYFTYK